ncbi:MAG: hypothetical protein K8M05_21045 [Deltaproteobacteria bacterium]|nr:hypothetical protein [Kofleriaceae bacterium]
MSNPTRLAATFVLALLALAAPARAESDPAAPRRDLHLDLEIDPTAYLLSGWSVHVGLGWEQLRLDLGTYAMDVPEALHGNDGWDLSFDGAGAKLQWFPFAGATQRGLFVDASVGVSRQRVTWRASGASRRDTLVGVGASAGWRFLLPYGLYATPWAGLSVDLGGDDPMVEGQRFDRPAVTPFAAVHVGYRFR